MFADGSSWRYEMSFVVCSLYQVVVAISYQINSGLAHYKMTGVPIKIHVRRAAGRVPNFTCICVYLCIFCFKPPGQTKNETDLKFGTHTPIDLTRVFRLARNETNIFFLK